MRDDATQAQVLAADPGASTWLSANAGSGKTRVLTDRVARLLLGGVEPQHILCLTYTKAAASEMQNRLFKRLGGWAMLEDAALRAALAELGVEGEVPPHRLARARQLFARAIETPGGLRIQTIHSFCATLLRRFPLEAGVSPQFTEADDRAARLLRDEIADDLAETAPAEVAAVARAFTGEDFGLLIEQIARARGEFTPPLSASDCRAVFGVPDTETIVSILDSVLLGGEDDWLPLVADILATGSANDLKAAAALRALPLQTPDLGTLIALEDLLLTGEGAKAPFTAKTGTLPTKPTQAKLGPLLPRLEALMLRVEAARPRRLALQAAQKSAALHAFAAAFLPVYAARKAARGWLDFDDLITRAKALLTDPSVAQWVLFRLDGGIDHILVDEAQDTSPDQWAVIELLAAEFTAGRGAQDHPRTIFVVGDKKQSIYSFQGADVRAFDAKRAEFGARLQAIQARFQALELQHSFRSSPAILDLVDRTFDDSLKAELGGDVRHRAFKTAMPGRVELWPAIVPVNDPDQGEWFDPVDLISDEHPAARLAADIAARIRQMIDAGTQIPTDQGPRPVHAGDFLILVQRRSAIFAEVIRACKAQGLPIAGADRLKLGAELAVKDIAALLSFLATPEDDLSLAAVLRSPLCGWTEAELYALAEPRQGYLWQALRATTEHTDTLAMLSDLRDQADYLRPFDLIERALTRHDGRRKLLARLGPEAEDGIDELLSQALAYEQNDVPSLTGFLIWLETDDVEVKRQMDSAAGRIRVMTVHGAKGLEAPIVILPDTADRKPQDHDEIFRLGEGPAVWKTSAGESPAVIEAERTARAARRAAENLRLLYVAMTRAQSWLIVAAAGEVKTPAAWYNLIARGMEAAGAVPAGGGLSLAFGEWPEPRPQAPAAQAQTPLPDWARTPAPEAPRAPLPLSPSDLGGAKILPGDSDGLSEEAAKARGHLLHRLLEDLPATDPADWPTLAAALIPDPALRADVMEEVAAILSSPILAPLFAPGTLAEVPLTAEINGRRMLGTIDRLVVTPDAVLAVDFKSNRKVPLRAEDTPEGYLRQMGAYAEALAQIYPNRPVRVAILWTRTGRLMPLSPDIVRSALARSTMS